MLWFDCYSIHKCVLGFMEMYTNWFIGQMPNETGYKLPVCSWFFDLNVSQVTIAFLVLYGLIVAQVASAIFFLWCDCCASHNRVLSFMVFTVAQVRSTFSILYGLIVAQVTSEFLVLWFDCGPSHKRVLGFTV